MNIDVALAVENLPAYVRGAPPGQFNQRGTCNTPSEVAAEQRVVKRPPFKHRGLVAASIDEEPVVRCACVEED